MNNPKVISPEQAKKLVQTLIRLKKEVAEAGDLAVDPWQLECIWVSGVRCGLALHGEVVPPVWEICQFSHRELETLYKD